MKRTIALGMLPLIFALAIFGASCRDEEDDTQPPPAEAQQQAEPSAEGPRSEERRDMVHRIVVRYGLQSDAVISAMEQTRRHLFIPEKHRDMAYRDMPVPIGHGQTISAPSIVALMTELLQPDSDDIVLEVGTGSGYQAAVLARLVRHVYTIEIVEDLAKTAKKRLKKLGYQNVTVKAGDGYKGWPEHAPFDGIIVTCAPTDVPDPLVQQLAEGGRMVIPVGEQWKAQQLYVLTRADGKLVKEAVLPVMFVPMTGEAQHQSDGDDQ